MQMCECRDPGCPSCKGTCPQPAVWIMYRLDMEDQTGTPMCAECAGDAVNSGLYGSKAIEQLEPVKAKSPRQERTITIIKDEGFDDTMAEYHGHTAFQNAIGYLAEWNMWANRFGNVTIHCQPGRNGSQPEIGASYTKTRPNTAVITDRYFICAIFWPQTEKELAKFTFHS
jgi:hypothetical protein